jgi:Ion channel
MSRTRAHLRTLNAAAESERARDRYGLLLAILFVTFGIQGATSNQGWVRILVTALLGAALVVALWAADARPHVTRLAFAAAALLLAVTVVAVAAGEDKRIATSLADLLLVAVAPAAVVVGVLRGLRRRQGVTVEAVFGALCLYMLVGFVFAFIYGVVGAVGGRPFFANHGSATPPHYLYFSFTTLTTVGYGDYTAASNLGHTLSNLEALTGQIYLVTVVSVIVGNVSRRSRPSRGD